MALDANTVFASSMASDQEKFLAAKLLERNLLMLVCTGMCDKIQQPDGTGTTANFVRYNRMDVPLAPMSEGVQPAATALTNTLQQVFLDQWGAVVQLTDVAIMTTKHPLLATAIELLADNAQRVIDREIQLVWLAGTNVQYFDGSVASRSAIVAGSKITDDVIHKAGVSLFNGGAQPRGGPASGGYIVESADSGGMKGSKNRAYIAITADNVIRDVMKASTSLGVFASTAMYNEPTELYVAEVGMWLGFRWVKTNFLPFFTLLGNTTAAVTSGSAFGTNTPTVTAANTGGALAAGTYFFKVTQKTTLRGFEENISIAHSIVVGGSGAGQVTFAFPSATGFAYNLYFDATSAGGTSADSNLLLVQANIAPSASVVVTAVPASGANPPQNINPTGANTVYPIYMHGANSTNLVTFQALQTYITPDASIPGNVLRQIRQLGYKFMQKASIRNAFALLRVEVNSAF